VRTREFELELWFQRTSALGNGGFFSNGERICNTLPGSDEISNTALRWRM
jgi:hypothetical protein